MVEHDRANMSVANLTAAAKALNVSVDFLYGLTADATPARQLAKELADSRARVRGLQEHRAYVAARADGDHVGVYELAATAGGGAVDHERLTGRVKFRREWVSRHGLAAGECRVIQVLGESRSRRRGRPPLRHADGRRPRRQAGGTGCAGAPDRSSATTRTTTHGQPCHGPATPR